MIPKRAFVAFFCAAVICGCNNANRQTVFTDSEVESIVHSDSTGMPVELESVDSFVIPEEPLPEAIDELFDDFVFAFDQNPALQRRRVRFPLTIEGATDGDSVLTARNWQRLHVFLQQDFCTVLWSKPSETLLSDDINVVHAEVDQLYLNTRRATTYTFDRDSISGHWQLTGQRNYGFEATPLADFLTFYTRFAADSIFQREHVSNHLRFVSTDEDGEEEPVVGFIDVDQWFEFAPELPVDVLTNINYGQHYDNPRRMIMQMRGISNGLQTELSFVREGESWHLVGYIN